MSSSKKSTGKNHRVDNQIDPYQSLANAIVLQAIGDYRSATKELIKHPKNAAAKHTCEECLKFFRSRWFGVLTDVKPEIIIAGLTAEWKRPMIRVALKKLYESIALRRAVLHCGKMIDEKQE